MPICISTCVTPSVPELSSLVASSTMRRLGDRFLVGPPIKGRASVGIKPSPSRASSIHQQSKPRTLGRGRRRRHAAAVRPGGGIDLVAVFVVLMVDRRLSQGAWPEGHDLLPPSMILHPSNFQSNCPHTSRPPLFHHLSRPLAPSAPCSSLSLCFMVVRWRSESMRQARSCC